MGEGTARCRAVSGQKMAQTRQETASAPTGAWAWVGRALPSTQGKATKAFKRQVPVAFCWQGGKTGGCQVLETIAKN